MMRIKRNGGYLHLFSEGKKCHYLRLRNIKLKVLWIWRKRTGS